MVSEFHTADEDFTPSHAAIVAHRIELLHVIKSSMALVTQGTHAGTFSAEVITDASSWPCVREKLMEQVALIDKEHAELVRAATSKPESTPDTDSSRN